MSSNLDTTDCLVIGAGISGLLCATQLKRSGVKVRLLDKGRGAGGRMTTRRMEGARLDHGAQFFTVRDPVFQAYVDDWLDAGIIREWFRKAPYDSNPEGYPRYCGIKGMAEVPRYLGQDIDVHCSEVVNAVKYTNGVWQAFTQSGATFSAHHLVVTAPLPQALPLVDTSGLNYAGSALDQLQAVRYKRGLTTLAILENSSGLPEEGYMKLNDATIHWLADNQIKGISEIPSLTLQSSPEFADMHWDSPDSVRGHLMLKAAAKYLELSVKTYVCHRWGFALSESRYHKPYFHNPEYKLLFAGDGFSGGRVEGAALSGIRAAEELLKQ